MYYFNSQSTKNTHSNSKCLSNKVSPLYQPDNRRLFALPLIRLPVNLLITGLPAVLLAAAVLTSNHSQAAPFLSQPMLSKPMSSQPLTLKSMPSAVTPTYGSWQSSDSEDLALPSLRGQGLSFDEQYQNKLIGEWSLQNINGRVKMEHDPWIQETIKK